VPHQAREHVHSSACAAFEDIDINRMASGIAKGTNSLTTSAGHHVTTRPVGGVR
jgi:hypothetical protein